jgi:hypothetical protein
MDKTCDAREHQRVARRSVDSLLRVTSRTSAEYLTNRYSTSCISSSSSRRRRRTSLTAACGVFRLKSLKWRPAPQPRRTAATSPDMRAGHHDYIVNEEAVAQRNLAALMIDHLSDRTSRAALPIRRLGAHLKKSGTALKVTPAPVEIATEGAIDPVPCPKCHSSNARSLELLQPHACSCAR